MAPLVTLDFMRDAGLSDAEFVEVLRENPKRLFGERSLMKGSHAHAH